MPPPKRLNFKSALDFAHLLADRSGETILPYFRKAISVENKKKAGGFDPVTAADRAAERTMSNLVARTWPGHGVIGEEFGVRSDEAQFRWVLDPIDGTRAFIMGAPLWGTLIGLLDGDTPVLGVMNQPFTRERFWSSERAAHVRVADGRAKRLSTRPCPKLSDAILASTDPDLFATKDDRDAFQRLTGKVRMTRYGGDCYNYCLLAAGLIDLVVESGLKPHDIVALIPIVERAGGCITTWDGAPATAGGQIIAAGDAKLHQRAMKVLQR